MSALLWLCLSAAYAEGIDVRKAEAHFSDDSYQLSADFDLRLKFVVEQALEQGVPLYFVSEFTLTHPRWYWLDEEVTRSEQTIKLSYNTLTRQYRITHGALFQNFVSLDNALHIIGHQSAPQFRRTYSRVAAIFRNFCPSETTIMSRPLVCVWM